MVEKIELQMVRTARNKYKVPLKQWKKWNPDERCRFNEVYSSMILNQRMFLHPKVKTQAPDKWKTTAWNAAWTAPSA